jgi:DNA-binding winged helix-turn-helix (wHTH) protein/tetratricopeptide (TPR) repeat protein
VYDARVTFGFGEFVLDPAAYELRRKGRAIDLQPKVFELVAYLLEHRERVVNKHELLAALWPDVNVSESSLAWCVSQARKALDQDRGSRTPIETIHGRGYRFSLEVRTLDGPSVPASPVESAEVSATSFIGRRQTMRALRRSLTQVRTDGRGAGHLLLGDAGIGKTRCAMHLASEARSAGVSVWTARCLEAEGAPMFWPWIQILRDCLRERADGRAAQQAAALLADLVPAASEPLEPTFTNGRAASFWLLDRLATWLAASGDEAPRVLVLDDLQWADELSLRVLDLLVPEHEKHRLVLIATVRDTEAPTHPSARACLARLARHLQPTSLTGFEREELEEYLTTATGVVPAPQLVLDVQRKTGGNPLFVEEMARRILEWAGQPGTGGDLEAPSAAADLVVGRLERRDPEVLTALGAASILGERFELPVLATMMSTAPERLAEMLATAVKARVLRGLGAVGAFEFVHTLVRDAIQKTLPEGERSEWHRRAGEALEARAFDDERLTQLAFHFGQALPGGSPAKAVRYAAAAARAAEQAFAYEDARARWRQALEALEFDPQRAPSARGELLVGLASSELQLGLRQESRDHLKLAIRLARPERNGSLLVAAARVLRHSLLSHLSIDPVARGALESALPELTEAGERSSALSLLAAVHGERPVMIEGEPASARAIAIARPIGGQTLLEALWSRTFSMSGPDDLRDLLEVSDEMLRLDASLGRSWWSGEAHYAGFSAHSFSGDTAARERALAELGRMARQCRLREAVWHHDRLHAQLAFQRGEFEAADRAWSELAVREGLAELGYVKVLHAAHKATLEGARRRGPATTLALWQVVAQWSPGPRARALQITSLLEAGRDVEARPLFEEIAMAGFETLPRDRSYLACLSSFATAAIALGDRPRAAELAAILGRYADLNVPDIFISSLGSAAHYVALLADFLGDARGAAEHFERAMTRNEAMGLRPRLAETQLAFARSLMAAGATARASSLASAAAEAARELGMETLLTDARSVVRSLR